MTFAEALDVLKQGGRVSREVWHGAQFLMVEPPRKVDPGTDITGYEAYLVLRDHLGWARPFWLDWRDVSADDWSAVTN